MLADKKKDFFDIQWHKKKTFKHLFILSKLEANTLSSEVKIYDDNIVVVVWIKVNVVV